MKFFYKSVSFLDKRAYDEFYLSEDILMEHAALALKKEIDKYHKKSILIVCGPGNNGADGITLARLLQKEYKVKLFVPFGAKSLMAKLQLQRAKALKIPLISKIKKADIVVDALFGSGLNKPLNNEAKAIIDKLNSLKAIKIACDIPSGIDSNGNFDIAFRADVTICMGALKEAYFYDKANMLCGKIKNTDLGLSYKQYTLKTNTYVLEKKDLKLPVRKQKNSHKGDYGQVVVLEGEMPGAPTISALAALHFGAGLVSIVGYTNHNYPISIMRKNKVPKNSILAFGMGLGNGYSSKDIMDFIQFAKALVVDADLFKQDIIKDILKLAIPKILTPHPKEFASLLEILDNKKMSTQEILQDKFNLAREFSLRFKNSVLILKCANSVIAYCGDIYVCPFSEPSLAKGGSGDVLAGMLSALLAQGYSLLDSAISGVLAHIFAARKNKNTNYSLVPEKLIKNLGKI